MVGPVPDADRDAFARRLKLGIVLLVGVSAGLIAIQGEAPLVVVGAVTVVGLVVGVIVVRIVFPGSGSPRGR